jgi:hypothetical protein
MGVTKLEVTPELVRELERMPELAIRISEN